MSDRRHILKQTSTYHVKPLNNRRETIHTEFQLLGPVQSKGTKGMPVKILWRVLEPVKICQRVLEWGNPIHPSLTPPARPGASKILRRVLELAKILRRVL